MHINVRSPALSAGLLAAGFAGLFGLVWWIGQAPTAPEDSAGNAAASFEVASTSPGGSLAAPLIRQPVTGNWAGNISLGRQHSELFFNIEERLGQLGGTVRFPVGDGVIQSGSRVHNQVQMTTLNASPSTGQMLRTKFSGHYEGDRMRLVMTTETGTDELILQRMR